jgi:hypothetical protein
VPRVIGLETRVTRRGAGSYAAVLSAVLDDGSRVVLLDDRGWSESPPAPQESYDELAFTARTVVGPDEGDDEAAHWAFLAGKLVARGVLADGVALAALPHDVTVSGPA